MGDKAKSFIRHLLTALGSVLMFLGVANATDITQMLLENLDSVWESAMVIIGFVTALFGFLKDKTRHKARDSIPVNEPLGG